VKAHSQTTRAIKGSDSLEGHKKRIPGDLAAQNGPSSARQRHHSFCAKQQRDGPDCGAEVIDSVYSFLPAWGALNSEGSADFLNLNPNRMSKETAPAMAFRYPASWFFRSSTW
jgi:hypothetical protein